MKTNMEAFAKQDPASRILTHNHDDITLSIEAEPLLQAYVLILPRTLTGFSNLKFRDSLGWQDRQYGTIVDPRKAIADTLMDVLLRDDLLGAVFREDKLNCVAEDLGKNDWHCEDSDEEVLDFTACSVDDCGFCGHCMY